MFLVGFLTTYISPITLSNIFPSGKKRFRRDAWEYLLMLLAILLRHTHAHKLDMFLERRVDHDFLADGMPREFPHKQVLVPDLLVAGGGADEAVVDGFEGAVVCFDGGADCFCVFALGGRGFGFYGGG